MRTVKVPEHIDWLCHRVACSERYSSSLHEIQSLWSIDDLFDAHELLNLLESS